MSVTHRHMQFGLKVAVLFAQNCRWELESIETSIPGANQTVFRSQNDRWGLEPIETDNSVPKDAVLQSKSTDEGGDPLRLVILMLSTLLFIHKTTGEV